MESAHAVMDVLSDLPDNLQSAINTAYQSLVADPECALGPYYRLQIYQALNWQVRGMLAVLTVWRHLDIWYAARPDDRRPEHWLATAEGFLRGQVVQKQAQSVSDDAMGVAAIEGMPEDIEELFNENWQAASVLYGASEALRETLQDYGFDEENSDSLTPDDTDAIVEPWNRDTALWIVYAYAGRLRTPESSSTKRQEFWTWWLNEAIPAAWTLVHED